MYHFVRSKNRPYCLEDVKRVVSTCKICCECKPQFYRPGKVNLIKATKPFDGLNVDFKGPLQSQDRNRYFLQVVDEFLRFPFVFPCLDMTASTVIKCLTALFSLFGTPAYVNSDCSSFMSEEVELRVLTETSVATSRTIMGYNPEGSGQVE